MRFLFALLALIAGAVSIDATAAPRDWTKVVSKTATGSYLIGNPKAKVKLVEYLSYTCPHCAEFLAESSPVLKGQMVRSGSTSIEFRNAVREKLDLSAALLARCAGPGGFVGATDAMFAQQESWYERGYRYQMANEARLAMYPEAGQLRALADGAGLTDLMRGRGMSNAAIDACFANQAELMTIATMTSGAWAKIDGTPAFEVNGKLVKGVGWAGLQPILRAAGAK